MSKTNNPAFKEFTIALKNSAQKHGIKIVKKKGCSFDQKIIAADIKACMNNSKIINA